MRLSFAVALLASLSAHSPAQTASATPIGVACTGTNGAPNLAVDQPPYLGETITFLFTSLPTLPGFVFLALGTDDTVWHGMPLPADLGFTGMPGCNLYVAPEVAIFMRHGPSNHQLALFIPNSSTLDGCRVLGQALVCDSRVGNALGATTTNAVVMVLGPRVD